MGHSRGDSGVDRTHSFLNQVRSSLKPAIRQLNQVYRYYLSVRMGKPHKQDLERASIAPQIPTGVSTGPMLRGPPRKCSRYHKTGPRRNPKDASIIAYPGLFPT